MGTHISFVRSATLDSLNVGNLMQMEFGGNARAAEFFRSRGVKGKVDYNSVLASQYKEILKEGVTRAAESNAECLSVNPETAVVVPEAPVTTETSSAFLDDSLGVSDDTPPEFKDFVDAAKPAAVEPVQQTPLVVQSATSAAPLKPLPMGKQSAKLIDDFDFDTVPESVPTVQTYTSPVIAPSRPVAPAEPQVPIAARSLSSAQFWGDEPSVSARSSPSNVNELTEKGRELMSKGFQAGKDWYNSFMNR
jgi:hypothetical protein